MIRPTPLIVCGMGRSGTRNAADVLNAHDKIHIHGEIPHPVMGAFLTMLKKADRTYKSKPEVDVAGKNEKTKRKKRQNNWLLKKDGFLLESFGYLSKSGRGSLKNLDHFRFVGHKTPKTEHFFERYEEHFGSAGVLPIYIYCARNAEGCWRSYKSMPWNKRTSAEKFIEEYANSFAKLRKMLKVAPDRVITLYLDDIISADNKLAFYKKTIFDRLGLELTPAVKKQLSDVKNTNATTNVKGSTAAELTDEERTQFTNSVLLKQIKSEFFSGLVLT